MGDEALLRPDNGLLSCGKGDVGKVYLVREKKSGRLYAMKGMSYGARMWRCADEGQF